MGLLPRSFISKERIMSTPATTKKVMVPYFSRYYFYGSYLFPLFALPGALLSQWSVDFVTYSVFPLAFLLILSLHRVSWGKRPRFGAHFTWAMLGLSIPVVVALAVLGNWIGAVFLAAVVVLNITTRRRFCRALTRLPKL